MKTKKNFALSHFIQKTKAFALPLARWSLMPFFLMMSLASLQAQLTLTTGIDSTKRPGGDGCAKFTIGSDVKFVRVKLRGADGGNTHNDDTFCSSRSNKGGSGATIGIILKVDANSNTLSPGGEIRVVPGHNGWGESRNCSEYSNAGGGGSSGVIYKAPNSSDWVALAVAGGGGGSTTDAPHGLQGQSEDGFGASNADAPGNGNAGTNSSYAGLPSAGGGGGYNQAGVEGAESPFSVNFTTPRCGASGAYPSSDGGAHPRGGGSGFSGGGWARSGGGGGGGYSGGAGGGVRDPGRGGTSYIVPNSTFQRWIEFNDAGSKGGGNENQGYVFIEAAPLTWTGATNTDWNIASNWLPPLVPTSSDIVLIPDVTNDPQINVGYTGTCATMIIGNNARMTVKSGAVLTIPSSTTMGVFAEGELLNQGTVTIGSANTQIAGHGIHLINFGKLTNSGTVNIDNYKGYGIYANGPFVEVVNNATFTINIGQNLEIREGGILVDLDAEVNNFGTIKVKANGGRTGVHVRNGGLFNNRTGGRLELFKLLEGLKIEGGNSNTYTSRFNNMGTVTIDRIYYGIRMDFGTNSFHNQSGGQVTLAGFDEVVNGIYISENEPNNTFINEGNLELIRIGQIDGNGASGTAVFIVNGLLINNGYWKINGSMNVNYYGGILSNGPCALLEINGGRVLTYNRLVNNGAISYDYTGGFYNDMSGVNNGVISTTRNYIGGIESNNNGLIIKPKSGVCTIPNLATIGTHNTFVIGSNFYSDPAQTTLTATYSNNTLQFTGNQINTQRLYASVTNPANNCSRVIPVWAFFIDNTPPTITCPADFQTNTHPGICGMYVPIGYSESDNCGTPSVRLVSGVANGQVFPVGITTNTYEATDAGGNTATCSVTVTVVDTEKPTISCPSNITTSNDANSCDAIVTYIGYLGQDNCSVAITSQTGGLGSGAAFPIGTTTETYQVEDAQGNTSTCSFTVTVNDTEAPVANCPKNIIVSNDQDVCGANVQFSVTTSDNCPGERLNQDEGQTSGTTFPKGVTTNSFTVTDASGNTGACSFTVTVNDAQAPVANCPADITVSNDQDICGAVVTYSVPTTDNCPGESLNQDGGQASGTTFPKGVTANSFTVTDASGNTGTCSFTVTVNDTQDPVVHCPANITASNDWNLCEALVNYTVTTEDNCPGESLSQSAGMAAGSSFPVGVTVNSFEAMDASGNTSGCSFTITVNDVDHPVFSCPTSNVVRTTDLGMCDHLAIGQDLDPVVSDNCSIQSLTNDYNQSSSLDGAVFPKGKTLVTWTATDPSGNSTVCSYNIKINDKEAPIFDNCPSDTTITIPFAAGGSYHTWPALIATDNCNSPSKLTITGFPLSGSYFSVGTTPVNWTVTDKKNNTSHCDFDVTVVEQGAPTPTGWTNGGVGSNPNSNCATNYDDQTGTLTIITSGGNVGGTSDSFCGISLPNNDQVIDFRARVTPPGAGYYDQAGIMMRQNLNGNAACASMYLTGTSVPIMGLRPSAGSMPLSTAGTAVSIPYWVRLYRFGATIQGYISADGVNWTLVKSYPNVLSSPLYLVLFAKTGGAQGIATIDNISINGTASRMSLRAEETALSLEAYPNPFSEDLFIKVANALPGETYHVRLSNMMGQRVYGYETGASAAGTIDQRISLEHLAAGTYLLEVSAGVQRKAIKVQKF